MREFTHDGFVFRSSDRMFDWWEVYWNGWVAIDGATEEEVKANWPRNKEEIIQQRLEQL